MSVLSLDHVGIVGPDMARLRAAFARLGFAPTEPRPLMRRNPGTGELEPLDQWSCHAVLRRGYVELSSVSTSDGAHHLASYATRPESVQILALGTDDVEAQRAGGLARGLRVSPAAWAAREITYGQRRGEARFHWFMLDAQDSPDGLVCFVRNHTPELVYQPEATSHPNGAVALAEVAILASDVAATARRYERAFGFAPEGSGGDLCFPLAGGALRVLGSPQFRDRYGPEAAASPDSFGLLGIEVEDLAGAYVLLSRNGVRCIERDGTILVPASEGCGAALCLRPPG